MFQVSRKKGQDKENKKRFWRKTNQNQTKVLDYWSLCFDTMILGNFFIHLMLPPSISRPVHMFVLMLSSGVECEKRARNAKRTHKLSSIAEKLIDMMTVIDRVACQSHGASSFHGALGNRVCPTAENLPFRSLHR